MQSISETVKTLSLPEHVKTEILEVYGLIAEAESAAHGKPVEQIHFHEVGTLDALADIAGVCLALDMLGPVEIVASPVHVGSGHVKCAHGLLPVPAPATAYILRGVPTYGGQIKGELCTPTGAALLKRFAAKFEGMPVMATEKIGYGMGKKDFSAANCVRAFLEVENARETIGEAASALGSNGEVAELSCNVDDMSAEDIGFAAETLMEAGALDVFLTPAFMKKWRPATVLTLLCPPGKADQFAALMLKHTTTFGVRTHVCKRYMLDRTIREENGARFKDGEGYGAKKSKIEYEDAAKYARENGVSIMEARRALGN
jgi:uncharacterized protein (TIGR00299 family) protein